MMKATNLSAVAHVGMWGSSCRKVLTQCDFESNNTRSDLLFLPVGPQSIVPMVN